MGIELKATLKTRKFRTPDMVCPKLVRFLLQDRGVRPHNTFGAGCPGTACLFCLVRHKGIRGHATDVAN